MRDNANYAVYESAPSDKGIASAKHCQRRCDADPVCAAWVFQPGNTDRRPPVPTLCKLKDSVPSAMSRSGYQSSGVKDPSRAPFVPGVGANGTAPAQVAPLRLSPADTTIALRVFVDTSVIEAFFQDGRAVMSSADVPVDLPAAEAGVALMTTHGPAGNAGPSTGGVEVVGAEVHGMRSIWVTPEAVREAPRPDAWRLAEAGGGRRGNRGRI